MENKHHYNEGRVCMSQTDSVNHGMSEDNGIAEDKTVPVSEAIRYRKRAQQAEKQLAELAESLSQARQHAAELDAQLAAQQRQQTLLETLTAAGATDLETTLLLALAERVLLDRLEWIDTTLAGLDAASVWRLRSAATAAAMSLIFEAVIQQDGDEEVLGRKKGIYQEAFEAAVIRLRLELDTNGDGRTDVALRGNTARFRRE